MATLQELNDVLNTVLLDNTKSIVTLLKEDPENAKMDSAAVQTAIKELLGQEEEIKHLNAGVVAITEHMERFFSQVEIKDIKENWEQGVNNLSKERSKDSPSIVSLQSLLGISEDTFEKFYAIGTHLYKEHQFEKAADVFFVLVNFNANRSNLWIALGLSLLGASNFESALRAFSMAAINDIDSPVSYLNAARCCVEMKDAEEAKKYISLALDKIQNNPHFGMYKQQAEELKKQITG